MTAGKPPGFPATSSISQPVALFGESKRGRKAPLLPKGLFVNGRSLIGPRPFPPTSPNGSRRRTRSATRHIKGCCRRPVVSSQPTTHPPHAVRRRLHPVPSEEQFPGCIPTTRTTSPAQPRLTSASPLSLAPGQPSHADSGHRARPQGASRRTRAAAASRWSSVMARPSRMGPPRLFGWKRVGII